MCGIISKLLVPEFRELCISRDILCFSETKCDDIDLINVKKVFDDWGFAMVAENRMTKKNKSGGVMICIKKELYKKCKRLDGNSETCISIKLDKKYIGLDKDIILISAYVPPFNSKYAKVEHLDDIENIVLNNGQECNYYLICGDFNAHTATISDICETNDFIYDNFGIDEASNDALEIISKKNEFGIPLQRYSVD